MSQEVREGRGHKKHKVLEGDNINSLGYLKDQGEKYDVIYIDPPYNTGKQSTFAYKDNFYGGHKGWLDFMEARLSIAWGLLREDGVMYISIDESESAYLKVMCDRLFGEDKYITQFVWLASKWKYEDLEDGEEIKTQGANLGMFRSSYEYVLCYRKSKAFEFALRPSKEVYIKSRITKKGNKESTLTIPVGTRCEAKDLTIAGYIGGESERIEVEGVLEVRDNKVVREVKLRGPFANPNMVERYFAGEKVIDRRGQEMVEVYITKTGVPYMKKEKLGEIPTNVLSGYGDTSRWVKELEKQIGSKGLFPHPKPYPLIKDLISLHKGKDIEVLDFFAGSGTTGEAVIRLNEEDGGTRVFTLCTNNEYQEERAVEYIERKGKKRFTRTKAGKLGAEGKAEYKEYKESEEFKEIEGELESLGICRSVTLPRVEYLMREQGIDGGYEYKVIG